jgi:hypothetical protein
MAGAAAVSLILAAAWREDSRLVVGTITVVTCVACLTRKLADDMLGSRQADGRAANRWTRARIIAVSAVIAIAVIGAADIVFFVVYWAYMLAVCVMRGVDHYWPWRDEPAHIGLGAMLGGIAALRTTTITIRLIRIPTARAMDESQEVKTRQETSDGQSRGPDQCL